MNAPLRFTLTQFRNGLEHVVRRRVKPTLALVESVGVDIGVDITPHESVQYGTPVPTF